MGYVLPSMIGLVLLNLVPFLVLRWYVSEWVAADRRRRTLLWIGIVFVILNLPLAVFFYRPLDALLFHYPASIMEAAFLPSFAWVTTLLLYSLLIGVIAACWAVLASWRRWSGAGATAGQVARRAPEMPRLAGESPESGHWPERRKFLAGGLGLALPAFYGVSAYGLRGVLDDLEISKELPIPIPHLPAALDGFRIVQLSDIHVGPYLRKRDLESIVDRVNGLRPDLVVLTGDLIDRDLASLPDAVEGLRGLQSGRGTFMVLGNHDIYADPDSYTARHRGGAHIVKAMAAVGVRTLRDETVTVGEGSERLAVMGLDWIDPRRGPSYLFYDAPRTVRALKSMDAQIAPETPKVLLAHHPETFNEAVPFQIGLTLAGHTHGGGQIVLGNIAGQPIGIAMLRFKFLRGLYENRGMSLYVNRGIGYLGLPIRINCPPEISQFRLVRTSSA